MDELKKSLKGIGEKKKGVIVGGVGLLVFAFIFMLVGLFSLRPGASVVKIGYGDIGRYQGGEWSSMANSGGYQDGHWANMLAFPILAVVVGVLHSIIAIYLYKKKGVGMAQLMVATGYALILVAWITLRRLLGEG